MKRRNSITDLIENYLKAIEETSKYGQKIGQILVETLKPIFPDIEYSLGWAEAGVDTICLWSEKREIANVLDEEAISLREIVEEVFGEEFYQHFDCPFGIWLSPDTAKKVKKALEKLKKKDI